MARLVVDHEILEAALIGLRFRQSEINARIEELRGQIAGATGKSSATSAVEPKRTRGPFRPAAKRRIALAQKRRWAAYRAAKAAAAAEAAKKTGKPKSAPKAVSKTVAKKTASSKAQKLRRSVTKKTPIDAAPPQAVQTAAVGD